MYYFDYDTNDIAKSIKEAINEYADPEVVQFLVDERIKKVDADAQYEQYRDDAVMKMAKSYINKYSASSDDIDALFEAKRDLAAQNLERASELSREAYEAGIAKNTSSYDNTRQNIYSAYVRSALGNEEALAANGLGRGISNKPSSGFGETSRMAQSMTYQNNIYNSYKDQNEAENALTSEYMKSINNAQAKYNEDMSQILSDEIEQKNEDRTYKRDIDNDRIEHMKFKNEAEQQAFENILEEKKINNEQEQDMFERMYDLFKATGVVVNEQMASVLGIPVGTDYWEYVIESQKAHTDYLNYTVKSSNASKAATNDALKQMELDVKKQNADTNQYKAETERMKLTGDY